jgi:hypothetical protein
VAPTWLPHLFGSDHFIVVHTQNISCPKGQRKLSVRDHHECKPEIAEVLVVYLPAFLSHLVNAPLHSFFSILHNSRTIQSEQVFPMRLPIIVNQILSRDRTQCLEDDPFSPRMQTTAFRHDVP